MDKLKWNAETLALLTKAKMLGDFNDLIVYTEGGIHVLHTGDNFYYVYRTARDYVCTDDPEYRALVGLEAEVKNF